MTNSSTGWQTIFVSFALILILFEVVRGWRLGVVRQMVRLLALVLAYATAVFGGKMLLPLLRPLLRVPDLFLSVLAGAVLALIVYAAINALGALLFKRTGQQPAGVIRLLYGLSGGALGIFFGLFTVWLVVVAIRSIGAIASSELHSQKVAQTGISPATTHQSPPQTEAAQSLVQSLARLKNSIEQGPLGETVKAVDVVPAQTYQTLGTVGNVVANPRSAERFLSYPGARELTENPKIAALRDDPEIIELIQQQRFLELLQNPKLIEAVNDPALAAQVRSFDFQRALDYAIEK
jgi:membrane protein required for colicin V production